jgi:pimeloyl-ACP methyl ester carboxylesterase
MPAAAEDRAHLKLAARTAGLEIGRFTLPRESDVVVGRMRLHYLDWGTRGRPPLLFLHGGGLTARTWDLVCLALRDRHRCLALDQRGHGDSEWSPELDYGPSAHARDIEGLLDRLRLPRAVLIGQSMGAINAMRLASQLPGRVRALVLVDAGPEFCTDGARRIADFVEETETVDSVEDFVEAAISFNRLRDPRLLRRSALHSLRRLPDGRFMRKNDVRWLRRGPERLAAQTHELWREVEKITCPTLVVRGGRSDVFLTQHAEQLAARLPDGRWVCVEGAGHTVQGDNPKGLVAALREFLAALP